MTYKLPFYRGTDIEMPLVPVTALLSNVKFLSLYEL